MRETLRDIPWRLAKSLSLKKERERTGLTLAEGPQAVLAAIDMRVSMEFIVVSRTYAESPEYAALKSALERAGTGVETFLVPDSLFDRISQTRSPQGVLCVLPFPWRYEGEGPRPAWSSHLGVLGVDVQDPGNVGTIIRAAAAAGATEVSFVGQSADAFSPKCIRASAGTTFGVRIVQEESGTDDAESLRVLNILDRLDGCGISLYKAVPRGGALPWDLDFVGPSVLVLGNEAQGLRKEVLSGPGSLVSIPMPGRVESLNVAMAAGMLLYEAVRQRLSSGPSRFEA